MIEPEKLFQLKSGFKRRKLALCFGALERNIAGIDNDYNLVETNDNAFFAKMPRTEYTKKLVQLVLEDPKLPKDAYKELDFLLKQIPFDERRACNYARNRLLEIIGTFPAEWDLVIAPHSDPTEKRNFFPNMFVYAEDIRSPFNLGSIYRTAEAFGAEGVFLSPFCTNENHQRAQRSAMGCSKYIKTKRCDLNELPKDIPVFALETGGTSIEKFDFPESGIVIIGSEELGVSPEALKRANYGRVTIPLTGIKASLNVGVAFGILMQAWTSHLLVQNQKQP